MPRVALHQKTDMIDRPEIFYFICYCTAPNDIGIDWQKWWKEGGLKDSAIAGTRKEWRLPDKISCSSDWFNLFVKVLEL